MESKQNLILGSSSPSRIELLKRIFHTFEIIKPDIEEPSSGFSSPREQVALISWLKGQEVSFQVGDGIIIAADEGGSAAHVKIVNVMSNTPRLLIVDVLSII